MVKRGALSKVEKFFIEGHIDLPVDKVASTLDRSEKSVQKYIDSLDLTEVIPEQLEQKKEPDPAVVNVKPDTHMQRLMGRHERNEQKVATVMTKSASQYADATRPARIQSRKLQEAIHRPRDRK